VPQRNVAGRQDPQSSEREADEPQQEQQRHHATTAGEQPRTPAGRIGQDWSRSRRHTLSAKINYPSHRSKHRLSDYHAHLQRQRDRRREVGRELSLKSGAPPAGGD
jgi:hypothetical protein